MPKRKREGSEPAEAVSGDEHVGKSLRQHRVEHKLDQGYKLLNRAFRTAKGFERQKLGRRRKTACEKGDAKDVTRIDSEIEAIKTLEFGAASRNFLHKSLLKFKAISESPDLPKVVTKPAPPLGDAAKANIIARLCNSNPVKEALPNALKDIQQALGLKISEEKLKGKKRLRAKDFEKEGKDAKKPTKEDAEGVDDDSDIAEGDIDLASRARGVMQRRPHSDNEDEMIESEQEEESEHDPADDYDSADFMESNGRIAASSDEEDDSDSKEESDEAPKKTKTSRSKPSRRDISASPEPDRSVKVNKSAFVPSLTMGGYWSGSESEPEDDVDVAPRKNRRGQRARRLLAEKKFGQKAKHIQEGASSQMDRDSGWDAKRGAIDKSGPRARGPQKSGGRSAPRTNGDSHESKPAAPPKKHRDDAGPLHPSWEAAKKAKEAKATAPFQGTRVTFD